jgi:hypothetical protein
MVQQRPNLILSIVRKLSFEELRPFLLSLKRTGYAGEIVFFVSGLTAETTKRLQDFGVQLISFDYFSIRMRQPALLLWPLWRRMFARMQTFEEKSALARRVFFFMVLRHLLYYEFLARNPNHYASIMSTDCRDVFFQRDPFARNYDSGLNVFLEDQAATIATCPHNRQMVTDAFGSEMLARIGAHRPSCAGVTIGDCESIMAYHRLMTELAFQVRRMPMVTGLDQGIHNYIVYERLIPNTHLHLNGAGGVLTMGLMTSEGFCIDESGCVDARNDEPIAILHQYDRHPVLAGRIKQIVAG